MGCDIHSYVERKNRAGEWEMVDFSPFSWRSYSVFGFLAGVRNYSAITPISGCRGLPGDISAGVHEEWQVWEGDGHSASWLSVAELVAFNYDAECEDRRYTKQVAPNHYNGSATCEAGQGEKTTFREFLGSKFFDDLGRLQEICAERVVFWFDN